jgi:hypothetical protein
MSTKIDAIASAFGIDTPTEYPVAVSPEKEMDTVDEKVSELQSRVKENISSDYKEVRDNFKSMIDSTMEMIPNLVDLVQQAESPRMYESAAAFMKMVSELNKDLLATSRELEKGAVVKGAPAFTPSNPGEATNIYIGTPGDVFSQFSKPKVIDAIEGLPVVNE